MIYVRDDLKPFFAAEKSVADFLKIDGEVFKQFPHRRTLKFERGGKEFFIKSHWNFGWREIIRKLLSLQLPVVSAKTEWLAIQELERIGLNTMKIAAFGEEGFSPATRKSFIITEALNATESLERWAPRFLRLERSRERVRLKHGMIRKIAEIAGQLHRHGLNHRDFYLCHFLLDESGKAIPVQSSPTLYLIDLHRMQIRQRTRQRWLVKDIAGIFYSSMDLGLTSRDFFRFMKGYTGKSLRDTFQTDKNFWRKVFSRAVKLYRQQHGTDPTLPRLIARR